MSESGSTAIARWSFGYDVPDDAGGGVVTGQFLLQADGVLLRRMGGSSTRLGETTWSYGDWSPVPAWPGETDPARAATLLRARGYDLRPPRP